MPTSYQLCSNLRLKPSQTFCGSSDVRKVKLDALISRSWVHGWKKMKSSLRRISKIYAQVEKETLIHFFEDFSSIFITTEIKISTKNKGTLSFISLPRLSACLLPSSLIMSSIILSHSTSTCRHVVFCFWNECPQIFILSSLSRSNTWMQQKKKCVFSSLCFLLFLYFLPANLFISLFFFASSSLLGGLLIWIYGSVFNVFFQLIFFLS